MFLRKTRHTLLNMIDYSSILLFVGTSLGRTATFKILPANHGTYSVAFVGVVPLESRIIAICPINAGTGAPAYASQQAVASLKSGNRINGVLVAITTSSIHLYKPAHGSRAHKTFDQFLCDSATVARCQDRGYAVVGLFGDGYARAYSLAALREAGSIKVTPVLDIKKFGDAIVTSTGDIFGWTGPSEMALLNVWGAGLKLQRSNDKLYNPDAVVPPRPTISNLQWISGTQYITPADMDLLIGGPGRPPSKRMIAELREAEQQQHSSARAGRSSTSRPSASGSKEQEGYWGYMQRQVQERTERLGIASDNMERLQQSSSTWGDDVSKFVAKQKRSLVLGAIGSKFGL